MSVIAMLRQLLLLTLVAAVFCNVIARRTLNVVNPFLSLFRFAVLSVALAPSVAVRHGESGVGRAVLVHQRFCELEDERVPGVK
jgi:hypothetical protein